MSADARLLVGVPRRRFEHDRLHSLQRARLPECIEGSSAPWCTRSNSGSAHRIVTLQLQQHTLRRSTVAGV